MQRKIIAFTPLELSYGSEGSGVNRRASAALWLEHRILVGFLVKCRLYTHLLDDKALLGTKLVSFLA